MTEEWRKVVILRKAQNIFGIFSGICLTIAMLALFDGLIAQMRAEPGEINVLAGERINLSGPAVLKNPVNSDLRATFNPAGSGLTFNLEGFFAGYWFGNGMWRGYVAIPENAPPGKVALKIAFKGASSRTDQKFIFNIYDNLAVLRENSPSLVMRHCTVNPFFLGSICGGAGIICGIITYCLGRKYFCRLQEFNLVEIQRRASNGILWCLVSKNLAPPIGKTCMVLDAAGLSIGCATVKSWVKGSLKLELEDASLARISTLVSMGDDTFCNDKSP